jgi:hypothetical protein
VKISSRTMNSITPKLALGLGRTPGGAPPRERVKMKNVTISMIIVVVFVVVVDRAVVVGFVEVREVRERALVGMEVARAFVVELRSLVASEVASVVVLRTLVGREVARVVVKRAFVVELRAFVTRDVASAVVLRTLVGMEVARVVVGSALVVVFATTVDLFPRNPSQHTSFGCFRG